MNDIIRRERKALIVLSALHIFVICSSNYLVQFPITINIASKSVLTTPAAFTYPIIFLATDLTIRIFNARLARRILAVVMIPALILSYFVMLFFQNGEFSGLQIYFDKEIFRIAVACLAAYLSGQISDIVVFNRLRQKARWWVAPSAASVFGSAVDTIIFFAIAFYGSADTFMADNWIRLGFVDYLTKLFVYALLFLPLYKVLLDWCTKKLVYNAGGDL